MGVIVVIAVIYFGFKWISEGISDMDMRNDARRRGSDFYSSSTGLRSTKSNKKVYFHNGKIKEF